MNTKGRLSMAAVSRGKRTHDLVPTAADPERRLPGTPRELYDSLPELPNLKIEFIGGRMVVSPSGTPEHADQAMSLARALFPAADKQAWRVWTGMVGVCLEGSRDMVIPDLVVAPRDAPRWGRRELLSSGLILVAEVVSPGSARDDRELKPGAYASGGVPVMILIDPECSPARITVFSDPDEGRYRTSSSVELGDKIHIPAPADLLLDTSVLDD
ncbi:Uma2 family endonuclease [Streptosporangium sp. NPDC000396]|uniref:Uma2 family endonuclease n=1 Tax=Streptosporangium sp. NPDC000396 TaxID=3366185 RepID=UPI00367596D2